MEAARIRAAFLDFFKEKAHAIYPSAPLVNRDDPTLLFINAGMNPFKDYLTGAKPAPDRRVADTQKCLRVSGKHNDLEEVGHDTYHHTFFEMLGNWSFGDYFKDEAIAWAWEFITTRMGLAPDRLYVTVFGGDATENLQRDDEAAALWARHIDPSRIVNGSKKDNFWEMGDTGPCGPCTEIHIDLRDAADRAQTDGKALVNADHPQVVEIWNVVFIQYNRLASGALEPLAFPSVDTGMGLERLAMALQGKRSTYDTDLFTPLLHHLEASHGCRYANGGLEAVAMRVAVDHIRAISLVIADGQLPAPTGAGYVVRRLLRRASRYAYQYLGIHAPFLHRLVPLLAEQFAGVFPELAAQRDFVARVVEQEEASFLQKLVRGTQLLEAYSPTEGRVDGRFAFELYDTYGFPVDLTALIAKEKGWAVDLAGFEAEMAAQKQRSKQASEVKTGDWQVLAEGTPVFVGYDQLEAETTLLRLRTLETPKGKRYQVVLAQNPFYAESGGQVGDTGWLRKGDTTLEVLDTQKENDLSVLWVDALPDSPGGTWLAQVDGPRRAAIRQNHSATHLLHAALRQVLGTHVEQRGSLVAPDYLRFDFSHFERVSPEQLKAIERLVTDRIVLGTDCTERRGVPLAQAKALGAMALFGEKYGEEVRVIQFDPSFSTELCGGTHVANTREIRAFRITSESSSAAGIRRIEAVTGAAALALADQDEAILEALRALLKHPKDPVKALEDLLAQQKVLEDTLAAQRTQALLALRGELEAQYLMHTDGHRFLVAQPEGLSAEELKTLGYELKKSLASGVIFLGSVAGGKPSLALWVTDDLTGRYNATELIRTWAKAIQGGGGGQPFFATAGGKLPEGLSAALAEARAYLAS
ncbi:MAG: alanine--tRNA ligase [Bacteroidia bacterium]|nr:alanine--tRNA ligase [Bacteroidia bacterium]